MEAGYTVKGTVRSKDKADAWIALFPQYKDLFQYAIVPDMVAPGSYDEAVKGCDYIVHTASPAALNPKVCIRLSEAEESISNWSVPPQDAEKDILLPAIEGTKNIVYATKHEPRIKRVIFTSSMAAVVDVSTTPDYVLTGKDWKI